MLSLGCLLAIGALFGFLAPLPLFAIFSVAALIAYASFTTGFSGLGRIYDVVFAAASLQVGYFLAVLIQAILERYRKRANTNISAETQSEQHPDPHPRSPEPPAK